MEGLRAGRPVHDAEVEAQRKDGTRVVLSVHGRRASRRSGEGHRDDRHRPRDISEQKRAAERAASREGVPRRCHRQCARHLLRRRSAGALRPKLESRLGGARPPPRRRAARRPGGAGDDSRDNRSGRTSPPSSRRSFERGHAELEARLLAARGEVRHFHFTGKRMDVDGAASAGSGARGIDVPEPDAAPRRALRESEDRYRDLVENSEDIFCTHDLEGNVPVGEPRSGALSRLRRERDAADEHPRHPGARKLPRRVRGLSGRSATRGRRQGVDDGADEGGPEKGMGSTATRCALRITAEPWCRRDHKQP